jgi:hypothetical protein
MALFETPRSSIEKASIEKASIEKAKLHISQFLQIFYDPNGRSTC